MLDVRGSAQEGGQLGGVDGVIWERREHMGDDALEIGVDVIGARQGHGLQACPESIGCGVMQAHVAFLNQAVQERKFYLIGSCLDRAFGVSIFEAASLEEAHELMKHDPSVECGVMSYEIHSSRISFFDGAECGEEHLTAA